MSDQDPTQTPNPYAAPSAPIDSEVLVDGQNELADRGTRLVASIVDSLIIIVPLLVILFATGMISSGDLDSFVTSLLLSLVGFGIWLAINFKHLQNGQTIGKKLSKIRIVDYNTGKVPPLATLAGIRYLAVVVISQLPFIGQWFGLIDVLFIFGKEKRCIHDLMAKTKVVKAA